MKCDLYQHKRERQGAIGASLPHSPESLSGSVMLHGENSEHLLYARPVPEHMLYAGPVPGTRDSREASDLPDHRVAFQHCRRRV